VSTKEKANSSAVGPSAAPVSKAVIGSLPLAVTGLGIAPRGPAAPRLAPLSRLAIRLWESSVPRLYRARPRRRSGHTNKGSSTTTVGWRHPSWGRFLAAARLSSPEFVLHLLELLPHLGTAVVGRSSALQLGNTALDLFRLVSVHGAYRSREDSANVLPHAPGPLRTSCCSSSRIRCPITG